MAGRRVSTDAGDRSLLGSLKKDAGKERGGKGGRTGLLNSLWFSEFSEVRPTIALLAHSPLLDPRRFRPDFASHRQTPWPVAGRECSWCLHQGRGRLARHGGSPHGEPVVCGHCDPNGWRRHQSRLGEEHPIRRSGRKRSLRRSGIRGRHKGRPGAGNQATGGLGDTNNSVLGRA